MADDLMGYLGLDTKGFTRSIKEAERSVGFFAKAGIIATGGLLAISGAINTFRGLGQEIDNTRAKLVAGSKEAQEFNDAIGRASPSGMQATGRKLDNFLTRLKTFGANTAEAAGALIADIISAATGGKKGDIQSADAAERTANEESDKLREKILKQEDAIASKRQRGIVTLRDQEKLLMMEVDLEKMKLSLYEKGAAQDREKAGASQQAIGALEVELELFNIIRTNENARAFSKTQAMKAEQTGQDNLAKTIATIAEYDEKILKARREKNGFLEQELTLQRSLALGAIAVAEHNMTPKQRRDQRSTEREFNRDVKKTAAHEKDLATRLQRSEREGHAPAPGSELDRFRRRRNEAAAARAGFGQAAKAGGDPQVQMVTHLASIDGKLDNAFKQK